MRTRTSLLMAGLASAVMALSSCAASDVESGGTQATSAATSGGSGETVVVGGPNFTEAAVMENMYALLLQDAGFTTEIKAVDNREVYFGELASGGSVYDLVIAKGWLTSEELDALLDPRRMTSPMQPEPGDG